MRTHLSLAMLTAAVIVCGGCVTVPPDMQELQSRNRALVKQVSEREAALKKLKDEKSHLQREVSYYTERCVVLEKEKQARIEASGDLRQGVREFTDGVMQSLRSYYQKTEIVDYVGGEVFRRSEVGTEKNVLLIDLKNVIASDGTLIGGTAYLTAPARLVFCLLRRVEGKDQLQVVRMSDPLASQEPGRKSWTFQVPLAVEKGDIIGAYFPENVAVPYDDVDTGSVVLVPGPIQMTSTVRLKAPTGRNNRAYSFGMVGFLN